MQSKTVKIIIIIACLLLAGTLSLYFSGDSENEGLESVEGQMLEVKCTNCGAEYEMPLTEYYEFRRNNANPQTQTVIQPPCKECGKNTIQEKELLEN